MKKKAFHHFFKELKGIPFEVAYWDDSIEHFGEGEPRFKLIFREEVSLAKFIKEPVMTFGEGYMNGHIEVEGSLRGSSERNVWGEICADVAFIPACQCGGFSSGRD